jgi:hypothetical protein
MGTDIAVARYQDGIPVVQSTTDRTTRFPTPADDQRVFNKGTGNVERYSIAGGGWLTDTPSPPAGRTVASTTAYLANNAVANVKDFGAIGDGIADDTPAFVLAKAASGGRIYLPKGTYNISGFDGSGITISGEGREVTTITGPGDLITNFGTAQGRCRLEHLSITNGALTKGKLVSLASGAAQRSAFVNVDFGAAAYHVSAPTAICVDWYFEGCRFQGATARSRDFGYVTTYREFGCYTANNAEGLRITKGDKIGVDGTFEYNTGYALNFLVADTAVGLHSVTVNGYFERNGVLNPDTSTSGPDINVEATAAVSIRNITVEHSRFASAISGGLTRPPVNMRIVSFAGASIQRLTFSDVYSEATQLCTNGFTPQVRQVEMSVGSYPTDAVVLDQVTGTYVPTVTLGGGSCTLEATATDTLQYTKVGRVVHVQGRIRLATVTTPSGTVDVSLPFTPTTGTKASGQMGCGVTINGMASSWTGQATAVILAGSTTLRLYELVAGSFASPGAKLAANCDIYLSFTFETAS